jgi:arsenite methyltransferase
VTASRIQPDYGIDAPGLVRLFFGTGFVSAAIAGAAAIWVTAPKTLAIALTAVFALAAIYLLGMGCLMVYWSKRVKLRTRESLLDQISWKGSEHVLDIGCGRGLMTVGAAGRLTSGQAIGIDIWRPADQSANTPEAAIENARREGVGGRVTIQTADMRHLPYDDASFDAILSHWAVHNLENEAGRKTALSEMTRLLRPGGTIILADIQHHAEYASELASLGLSCKTLGGGRLQDALLGIISFGSFKPFAIIARRP